MATSAQTNGVTRIEPCSLVSELQRQPQLEAWVRYGYADVFGLGESDCVMEVWVIVGPLDMEEPPDLVDFALLID